MARSRGKAATMNIRHADRIDRKDICNHKDTKRAEHLPQSPTIRGIFVALWLNKSPMPNPATAGSRGNAAARNARQADPIDHEDICNHKDTKRAEHLLRPRQIRGDYCGRSGRVAQPAHFARYDGVPIGETPERPTWATDKPATLHGFLHAILILHGLLYCMDPFFVSFFLTSVLRPRRIIVVEPLHRLAPGEHHSGHQRYDPQFHCHVRRSTL